MKYIKSFEANTKFIGHQTGPNPSLEVDLGFHLDEIEDYFIEMDDAGWKISYTSSPKHTEKTQIDNVFDIINPSMRGKYIEELFKSTGNKAIDFLKEGYKYIYTFFLIKENDHIDRFSTKISIMSYPAKETRVSHNLSKDIKESDIDKMLQEATFVKESLDKIKVRLENKGFKPFFYTKGFNHIEINVLFK